MRQTLPTYLCVPVDEPVFIGTTNADLIEYIMELRMALNYCNADKAAMLRIIGETE